jgi:dGTPase
VPGALATYAAKASKGRGRLIKEPESPGRSGYQRDRDRIVHCSAFRRLEYKTQVFLNHEGDHFRTRLTHTIEVAQIARTVARMLRLEEDLTESIALAHDLGHTPFGHAGQDALNACMRGHGGFEHNLQSLRVVMVLEQPYPQWDGLNLCFETLEGILKHCALRNAKKLGVVGERFVLRQRPSLEAQIANIADQIAYSSHDIDDGLRSGLLALDDLLQISIVREHWHGMLARYPALDQRRLVLGVLRSLTNGLVNDLVAHSRQQIALHQPADVQAVRQAPELIDFSSDTKKALVPLRRLLFKLLYRHPKVQGQMLAAQRVIAELFDAYCAEPAQMPQAHAQRAREQLQPHQSVADYIAGMTDRYALKEHTRLFGPNLSASLQAGA